MAIWCMANGRPRYTRWGDIPPDSRLAIKQRDYLLSRRSRLDERIELLMARIDWILRR